jgi:hypothetical protein
MAAVLVLGAGCLALTTSCATPDPGSVTFEERPHQGIESSSGTSGTGGTSGASGTAPPATDGGGTEGGTSSGAVDAFTGAAPYAPGVANGDSNTASHNIAPINNNNPAGNDCLTCHKTGGQAAGNPWVFAGTVYTTTAGATAAAAGVEVRMVSAAGAELASVYTDAQGNFFIDQLKDNTKVVPAGAKVGVRNGPTPKVMQTALTAGQGGCQSTGCHVAGAQGRVSLQ